MMQYINYKKLDLHGESRSVARVLVNEFIHDCYLMGEEKVLIIHGNGTGALKKEVQQVLKRNPEVANYSIDFFNVGQTIVEIKQNR